MDTKSELRDVPSRGYPQEGTSPFSFNKMVYFWIETLVYFSIEINIKKVMSEMKSTFETLEVWIKGRELRVKFSKLTKGFPTVEKFKLVDQIIRASRSVTANIAEGYGRFHYQENIQFCRISRGSLFELIEHLYVALDEDYIDKKTFNNLKTEVNEIIKLLNGYINYLKKRKEGS